MPEPIISSGSRLHLDFDSFKHIDFLDPIDSENIEFHDVEPQHLLNPLMRFFEISFVQIRPENEVLAITGYSKW